MNCPRAKAPSTNSTGSSVDPSIDSNIVVQGNRLNCFCDYTSHHDDVGGSRGEISIIFSSALPRWWRPVVSFGHSPVCFRRMCSRYPLDRSLHGPQSRCGQQEKKSLYSAGNKTEFPGRPAPSIVSTQTWAVVRAPTDDGNRIMNMQTYADYIICPRKCFSCIA
jgi:hypothetical protein